MCGKGNQKVDIFFIESTTEWCSFIVVLVRKPKIGKVLSGIGLCEYMHTYNVGFRTHRWCMDQRGERDYA